MPIISVERGKRVRLSIRHETRYSYEGGGLGVALRLRLLPVDGASQIVEHWTVTLDGAPVEGFLVNSYGVPETAWRSPSRADETLILAEGIVDTRDCAGIVGKTDEAADPRLFLRETGYCKITPMVVALGTEALSPEGVLATLHRLSGIIHARRAERAAAEAPVPLAQTNLARVADTGQSDAHLFIAAARSLGIPARYVAGYRFTEAAAEEMAARTAMDLHGWAEAWVEGLGWVDFDPSANRCPDHRYVRLSWGMDAYDSAPLRGVAQISGDVDMTVDLAIALADMTQSQQQQ